MARMVSRIGDDALRKMVSEQSVYLSVHYAEPNEDRSCEITDVETERSRITPPWATGKLSKWILSRSHGREHLQARVPVPWLPERYYNATRRGGSRAAVIFCLYDEDTAGNLIAVDINPVHLHRLTGHIVVSISL